MRFVRPLTNDQKYLKRFAEKYDVNKSYMEKLNELKNFKTIFILDDSTSMNKLLQQSPLINSNNIEVQRWDELRHFVKVSLEITNLFNKNNSTDIFFLNNPPMRRMGELDPFIRFFDLIRPNGFTPISRVLKFVLEENLNLPRKQKLLIVIVTDGEPTDDDGNKDLKNLEKILRSRNSNVYVSMVACTDDIGSVSYLDDFYGKLKKFHVVDDFITERSNVLRVQRKDFRFSYGDYVLKALIGCIDRRLKRLNERRQNESTCNIS